MHPNSLRICRVYSYLYERGKISFPLRNYHREQIDSVVKTIEAVYFGVPSFSTPEEKAVAYLCLIINNHAFVDGNKRTAVLWFQTYCEINSLDINESIPLDLLAITIEQSNLETRYLIEVARRILFR